MSITREQFLGITKLSVDDFVSLIRRKLLPLGESVGRNQYSETDAFLSMIFMDFRRQLPNVSASTITNNLRNLILDFMLDGQLAWTEDASKQIYAGVIYRAGRAAGSDNGAFCGNAQALADALANGQSLAVECHISNLTVLSRVFRVRARDNNVALPNF